MTSLKLPETINPDPVAPRIPDSINMEWHQTDYGVNVRLVPSNPDAAAWSGVNVMLDSHFPPRPDGTRTQAWRVRIGWPACGSQDVEATEDFITLMQTAVLVARILRHQLGGVR